MNVVALFSGQGAQRVGMGHDWVDHSATAAAMCAQADEILGMPLMATMLEGPEEKLTRTSFCQPALYLHGLMALSLLQERVPELEITAAAGLSLGEFTAHAAAGTFSFADGLQLVAQRGSFMEEACANSEGSMAAMIGGEQDQVIALAQACNVDVANFNAPGQIVLSGTRAGINDAIARAKEFGVRRAIALNVAGAYHSLLMASAQARLAPVLASTPFAEPRVPVMSNVLAHAATAPDEIRKALEQQVTGSVRWTESMQNLISQGHRHFIEFGPGKVLAGLMGKIDSSVSVLSVEDMASLDATIAALRS